MKSAWLYLALAVLPGSYGFAQNAVGDWLPLHTGDRWIYDEESRDVGEGAGHREIHRWQTEIIVTGRWTVPEGTLVETYIRFRGGEPALPLRLDHAEAYLIRGDCVYLRYVQRDQREHQLKPSYRQDLLAGRYAPDFCFPLKTGKTWGGEHGSDGRPPVQSPEDAQDWRVSAIEPPDAAFLADGQSYHVTNLSPVLGSGEKADIWFKKGVGIVREEQVHDGTFGEGDMRLLRFDAAPAR